jgi:hypothetical protein
MAQVKNEHVVWAYGDDADGRLLRKTGMVISEVH